MAGEEVVILERFRCKSGLLRRFAPRNDGLVIASFSEAIQPCVPMRVQD